MKNSNLELIKKVAEENGINHEDLKNKVEMMGFDFPMNKFKTRYTEKIIKRGARYILYPVFDTTITWDEAKKIEGVL